MYILIIRHGQSEADILNVHEGRADFPLTNLGIKQATVMAEALSSNYKISKIYSSPLLRAKETAQSLSKATHAPITFEDNLMEFNNGLLAGLSREEANEKYPEPEVRYPHTALYGMESMINFRSRAEAILSKIIAENNPYSTIAIVAHGGIINMLLRSFLELPLNSSIFFSTGDTGVHLLQINNFHRRLVYSNNTEHIKHI
ncbi:MAG: histidine phosphatase family protein [Clostridium sp.]|uniref:histidine phosphatase family protein n=1 Tax=Clostridium culturomicium TaxID=1499683 RepID=UPI00058B12E2|nr:histidine phosphatase family protein [Clostridium culturomicium]MDU4891241.1 histidine phosphatase family protein [Clostridium sp.]MDU7085199.1 histidine phosphatase family protein [Clostridium sp.]